jgi:hypothetical protein
MQFAELNIDAMKRATDFIVGSEGTAVIAGTYHAIAAAMQAAYNEGYQEGRASEAEANEERLDNAFDEGFEQGAAFQSLEDEEDTNQTAAECFDDGYLEGVGDTLSRPFFASNEVQRILNARAADYFEALEATDEFVIDEA